MTTAVLKRTSIEVVHFAGETPRAATILRTLERSASGHVVRRSEQFVGGSDWLLLWGPGAPDRIEPMRAQRAAGGHVIALDLAYWQRDVKFRVSIDAAHPQAYVWRREWPRSRWEADRQPTAQAWQPTGHILVAGIGRKAGVQYGADRVLEWEAAQMAACRARWPERPILYRPKLGGAVPAGVSLASSAPIDTVLQGASLVITWHSNVAVDAIRMGIPVVCRDGAAAAVCPDVLPDDPRPLPLAIRDRFLGNLAWFQWAPTEAAVFWAFLRTVLA